MEQLSELAVIQGFVYQYPRTPADGQDNQDQSRISMQQIASEFPD